MKQIFSNKIKGAVLVFATLIPISVFSAEITVSGKAEVAIINFGNKDKVTTVATSDETTKDGVTRSGLDLKIVAEGDGWLGVASTFSRDNNLNNLDEAYAIVRYTGGDLTFGKKGTIADDYAVRPNIFGTDTGIGDAGMAVNDATITFGMPNGLTLGLDINNQQSNYPNQELNSSFDPSTETNATNFAQAKNASFDIVMKYDYKIEILSLAVTIGNYKRRGSVFGLGLTYLPTLTTSLFLTYTGVKTDQENYTYNPVIDSENGIKTGPQEEENRSINGLDGSITSFGFQYISDRVGAALQYASYSGSLYQFTSPKNGQLTLPEPKMEAQIDYYDGPLTYSLHWVSNSNVVKAQRDTTLSVALVF